MTTKLTTDRNDMDTELKFIGKEIHDPLKAIKALCLECAGGGTSAAEVTLCRGNDCPLFPFRKGRNPYRQRRYSPEVLEKKRNIARSNLAKATGNGKGV